MIVKALLFDFNGVIIDDEPIQMRAYQEILASEGIALSGEDYMSSLGMDDKTFVAVAYQRVGKSPDANKVLQINQAKQEKWREAIASEVPLFPGVENFIRKAANEFELGVVSMSNIADIEYILERTGLTDFFSIIISAEEVVKPKPDPQCYREGFRQIDLARIQKGHLPMVHGECVVIEDSPPGIEAARAADLPALGVANTVSADELRAAGASWVAKNLNDWWPESIRRAFM
ncbi:MAG: HAD family phosphatase [Acidobacteria bacterium]|nr:HAD family phosphatase [Acidobacteriota bacterium]